MHEQHYYYVIAINKFQDFQVFKTTTNPKPLQSIFKAFQRA
jgi:hypothetical protein